ncbi:conserved protein of unknown function [Methanoculleus bourgensis]|uniref:Uncharacterized protein n=1 Tax=Methanoculleus bourgensis TaxID=83986 RepID=A0A0X8XYV7_9EURY|nr:conserved protein of unknown function [Methanoculleus bourgensis]
MKCSTSGALHLILRVLAWITRKIAKGCGAFMGQSERLDAGKQPIPQALTPCCGPWWLSPQGWGPGRAPEPPSPQAAEPVGPSS